MRSPFSFPVGVKLAHARKMCSAVTGDFQVAVAIVIFVEDSGDRHETTFAGVADLDVTSVGDFEDHVVRISHLPHVCGVRCRVPFPTMVGNLSNQEARAQAPDLDRHTIAADRGLPIPIKLEGEYVCGA
jgi:hypothetical protein